MSSDIISCLKIDKEIGSRIIVVKEINGCDSSFIDNCVLSHCIKTKTPIIIISLHNSFNHYQNVGLKMNYNLQRHIESGLVEFYNLAEELVNETLTNNDKSTQHIFEEIKKRIQAKQINGSVNVILDGVSHMFDLEYTLRGVNELIKSIHKLLEDSNSFLLCHCNIAIEDDVTYVMSNLLAYRALMVVEVETLPSGWSTDVSGHLTVRDLGKIYEKDYKFTWGVKPDKYLFKLFDRGVKLLAPGTV